MALGEEGHSKVGLTCSFAPFLEGMGGSAPTVIPCFWEDSMLLSHDMQDGALRITLHRDLDIDDRAAAVLRIEMLIAAYRPATVTIELPKTPPSLATLSVIARAKRRCECLDVPLSLVESSSPVTSRPAPDLNQTGEHRAPRAGDHQPIPLRPPGHTEGPRAGEEESSSRPV
ncbi:hypothetical protein ACFVZH_37900 [Streptomyces sp. NPDC059534]|uniref:hypothetical protein n=1 Tax=Streptomyces sp. NPDC059534 TaxID=3346859 RepID=UPI0036C9D5B6